MKLWTDQAVQVLNGQLPRRLAQWSRQLLAAQLCYEIEPLLFAAILDRESGGGEYLAPKGPAGTGDHGHGRGLWQIDDRSHKRFTDATFDDGVPLWQDPNQNAAYAAKLLARNIRSLSGDVHAAVAAYNCGVGRVKKALYRLGPNATQEERIKLLDSLTTGSNYVSDVFRRRAQWMAPTV